MARHAKSIAAKRVAIQHASAEVYQRAVDAYRAELAKPKDVPRHGLRVICAMIATLYREETGKSVKLSHTTLNRYVDGGKTRQEANGDRAWLTPGEEEVVITFILEMARRGFPLSHQRLKEHVDMIARERWGDRFPESGVGKNWTARFLTKHGDRLKTLSSRPLEDKRGKCANPKANEEYWKILKEVLDKYKFKSSQIFGCDEVGIQTQGQGKERVIGARDAKVQHQQTGGSRENTTVIATICADGTALAPTVIFKGKKFKPEWMENNPLKAS